MIPLELGSGYNVRRDTPNFLGLELMKCRRQASYFSFPIVIRSQSFFSSHVFPDLVVYLVLSSEYVSLILVMFLLRGSILI